jgi:hypothetical protein
MKRKIRNIYIDGMEKSGKTSIIMEMRKHLGNKNKAFCEFNGINLENIQKQERYLSEPGVDEIVVLKQNSLMNVFYKDLVAFKSVVDMKEQHAELIRREVSINQQYGAVHFFIIPEDIETAKIRFNGEIPSYYVDLWNFYKNIDSISLTQGLNIELIFFDEFDRIYDVRDKILDIIDQKYEI